MLTSSFTSPLIFTTLTTANSINRTLHPVPDRIYSECTRLETRAIAYSMRAFLRYITLIAVFQGRGAFIFGGVINGEITPRDPNVVLNDTLELNCTVREGSGFDASDLFWNIHGEKAHQSEMFIVDNRTLQLRKTVTTIADEGTYSCVNDTGGFVSATDVIVEYVAVRNVSNFACIVDEVREELRCEWKLGKYNHENYLDIKIFASFDFGRNAIICPKTPKEYCTWSLRDGDIFAFSVITRLDISNKIFGGAISETYEFTNKEILKLKPAAGIQYEVLTSCSCFNLTWSPRKGNLHTTTKIVLTSKWDTKTVIVNSTTTVICDLIPASAYKLELQQKPTKGLYYSDPTERKFNTCIKAPSQGPLVFPSGFSGDNHLCENHKGMRNITLYWKKIPEKFQNGEILNYSIISDRVKTQNFDGDESSGSMTIPCDGRRVLNITGCNSGGCSPHSSITLPDNDEFPPPDYLIVEEIDVDEIYLFWNDTQDMSTIHIVWCKGKAALQKCQDEINTLPIIPSGNGAIVKRNEINQSFDDVIFGVATSNGTGISTGIRWQERCRYTKSLEPRKPKNVQILPEPPNDSLIVGWSAPRCDRSTAQNAYVHSYKIGYCQSDEQGICKHTENVKEFPVPSDGVTRFTVRGLEAEQKYGVWVIAVSLTTESQRSDVIIGIPKNDDLADSAIISIIVGGSFSFVLIISGLVCIIRHIRKKIGLDEKFPIQNIPIHRYKDNMKENGIHSQPNQSTYTQSHLLSDDLDMSYERVNAVPNGNNVMRQTDSDEELKTPLVPRQLSKDSGHSSVSVTSAVSQQDESSRNDMYVDELLRHQKDVPKNSSTRTSATISGNYPFSSEQRQETDYVENRKLNDFMLGNQRLLTKVDNARNIETNDGIGCPRNNCLPDMPISRGIHKGAHSFDQYQMNAEEMKIHGKDYLKEISDKREHLIKGDDYFINSQLMLKENSQPERKYLNKVEPTVLPKQPLLMGGFPNTSITIQNAQSSVMEDGYVSNTSSEIQHVEPTFMEDGYLPEEGYLPNTPIAVPNAESAVMEDGYVSNTSTEIQHVEPTFMEDGYLPEEGYLPNTSIAIQNAESVVMEDGYLPNTSSEMKNAGPTFMEDGYLPNTSIAFQNSNKKGLNYPSFPTTDCRSSALEDYIAEEHDIKENLPIKKLVSDYNRKHSDSVEINSLNKVNDNEINFKLTPDDVSPNESHLASKSPTNNNEIHLASKSRTINCNLRFSSTSDYTQIHTINSTTNRISSSNSMEDSGSLSCRFSSNTESLSVFDDPYIPLETLQQ